MTEFLGVHSGLREEPLCVHASPFSGRNNTEPTYDGAALLDKTLTNDEAAT